MGNVGNYILAVEGSIPAGMPEACVIYGKPLTEILPRLIERADYVVAVGTCAAFGGIPAAEGNYTGSVSVMDFMKSKGMRTQGRLVNCSSCPTHPDSLVGTFACLASEGYPKVDPKLLTPKMFYSNSTHDNCPRFHDYSKHIFAERFGDDGCLFKLGCLGPLSYTECPGRQWNGGVNWCVRASAPCIACSSPYFAKFKNFPFYRKGEREHGVAYSEKARKGGKE
jgi:hydrogenase small subunit